MSYQISRKKRPKNAKKNSTHAVMLMKPFKQHYALKRKQRLSWWRARKKNSFFLFWIIKKVPKKCYNNNKIISYIPLINSLRLNFLGKHPFLHNDEEISNDPRLSSFLVCCIHFGNRFVCDAPFGCSIYFMKIFLPLIAFCVESKWL